MSRILSLFFVFSLLVPSFAKSTETNPSPLSESAPESLPLSKIAFPKVDIVTLPNGLKLYLLEDHDLPVFQILAYVRGGAIHEPPSKTGLAALMGGLLRTGGTETKSVEEIDRLLENNGAVLETRMMAEFGVASLFCLSEDQNLLIPVFFEILHAPRFDPKQITIAKEKLIEALRRQNDEPSKIALREFPKLIYGPTNVWARTPSPKSLNAITGQDLIRFHRQIIHPDRMILAISGDFNREQLIAQISKLTEKQPRSSEALPAPESLPKDWQFGIAAFDRPGDQSTIFVGHLGEKRFNPDKYALLLMNYILGGDIFSSRLGEEIRSDRGLAYSVFSRFGLESDYGLFFVGAQTRSESTKEVIELIQKEIERLKKGEDFTEEELSRAKESLLNQMAGDWDPRSNYVKERARLALYGYPEDYLENYRTQIRNVSREDLIRVASQYLFPEKLQILVIGDLQKLSEDLKQWGTLKVIQKEKF